MPRKARITLPHIAHHITQRGNYRQIIFEEESDYRKYLLWCKEYSEKYKLEILGYCLISNHVHIIAIPGDKDALSRVFNTLHMRYAQYINRKRRTNGHLWQGRFFSCLLDEAHLYRAIRYIERNPVRAKIVKKPWDYEWSSARYHTGEEKRSIVKDAKLFDMGEEDWKEYLTEEDVAMEQEIRLKTQRGLVVGEEKFIKKIEDKIQRSLKCLNPGRPKKME